MTRHDNILWQDDTLSLTDAAPDTMTDQPETAAATFSALYRRHVKRVYAYCYRRVGNRADAEDLTEQVFAEALEKVDGYREQGKAAAWLFTIAHSRVVDFYRRQNHRRHGSLEEAPEPVAPAAGPEGQLIDAERRRQLFAVLDALDEDKRELILLRFGAELSFRDIGAIVGKREAAVKMALYRLLDELRATWHLHDRQHIATEEDHD